MTCILLIDDDLDVRPLLQTHLESYGHTVLLARLGKALLEDLETLRYDVVITDLHMALVDGWDVLTWVRRRRPHTPVCAISGNLGADDLPVGSFDAVLAKPFRREALNVMVGTVMAARGIARDDKLLRPPARFAPHIAN